MPEKISRAEFLKFMGFGAAGLLFAGIASRFESGKNLVKDAAAATAKQVNVRHFGAIGQVLTTLGDIMAGSSQLKVDNAKGWVKGAGVGIPGAAEDGTALVTRVMSIKGNVLILRDTATFDAIRKTITNDDRPPIQDAIDTLSNGGIVNFRAGTYIIGTPGASANRPILLGSNLHLIGAGIGETVLKLCDDVNILLFVGSNSSRFVLTPTPFWSAGPMFLNKGNRNWFFPEDNSTDHPFDTNIQIEKMTCDGNKNHQTTVYESQFNPNPTSMPPTVWEESGTNPSMQWVGRPYIPWRGTNEVGDPPPTAGEV